MSLIDPTNPARWLDGTPRRQNNGFVRGLTDEPINWQPMQRRAALRTTSTNAVERARANGTDRSAIHGLSRKADAALVEHRRQYSPVPENQAAGQRSTDRRAAIRRGGR